MTVEYEVFHRKLSHLTGLLSSLSLTERNLTLSVLDFQAMGLSKKHQIERALERADDLGKVIGVLIDCLGKLVCELKEGTVEEFPDFERNGSD